MKGFSISDGFMGYVDGGYMLFACESEYIEYIRDEDDEAWIIVYFYHNIPENSRKECIHYEDNFDTLYIVMVY